MDKKVVFITGASRGIGRATAEKFAKEGWLVAGFYATKKCEDEKNIKYYELDVSDEESVIRAFRRAFEEHGRVDSLINCAGVFGYKTLAQYDVQTMEKVIGVNEVGTYIVVKYILDYMKDGSIVLISSTAAQVGSTDPVYAGTEAAVAGFCKSMAKALSPRIRVNCVAPGVTESDMTKNMNPDRLDQLVDMSLLKKIGAPKDIANGLYFLASEEAGHITGACLDINGGYVLR